MLLAPITAGAQSQGCIERPIGPSVDGAAFGSLRPMPLYPAPSPHTPRGRGMVALPPMPSTGTECIAVAPPVRDILRGEPAPAGGLLRGDDGRSDLLRDSPPVRPPIAAPR